MTFTATTREEIIDIANDMHLFSFQCYGYLCMAFAVATATLL